MADFTSAIWDVYIGIITLAGIIACAVPLVRTSSWRVRGEAPETTGHTWDEDLLEYNNPLPRWWVWLFLITVVFALVYLALYPGLGSYTGAWNWTSAGQYQAELDKAEQAYGPIYAKFAAQDLKQVASDPEARAIGQKLFLNYCAQCHASDAGGSRGFPSLTDRDWLWGGEPEAIKASIAGGRTGVMPPFETVLGEDGVKDVAHYVRALAGLTYDSIRVARGKDRFVKNCAVCHGRNGKGNPQFGAPDLTDKIWLYGSSEPTLVESIGRGRSNVMPAHKDFLGEAKVHLLAAYVWGLSNPDLSAPAKGAPK